MMSIIVSDKISILKTESFSLVSVLANYMSALEAKCMLPRAHEVISTHILILLIGKRVEDVFHELVSMGECHFVNHEDSISYFLG